MKKNKDNPIRNRKYKKISRILLIVGGILEVIGIVLFVSGIVSMVSEKPNPFLNFFGVGLMGTGSFLLLFGLIGPLSRFFSSVSAPVHKDYVNYMREETADTAKEYYKDVASGVREGFNEEQECPYCHQQNQKGSRFCSNCGKELMTEKECPYCHQNNPVDAKYCNRCGKELE